MARTVSSLIAGRTREDAPGGTQEIPNPARLDEIVATVGLADATTFVEACAAARSAQRDWARVPAPVRGRAIQQLGRLVEDNAETLARIMTREIGKPIAEARGEVQEVVDTCNFFVSEGRRLYGMTVPSELPGQAAVHVPQPGRRRGDRHGGELPGRGPVLVPGPGAPVRQRRRVEAGRVHARDVARRSPSCSCTPASPTGCSTWCSPTGPRRSRGSRRRSRPGWSTRSGSRGRARWGGGSASSAGATCRRRAWSSAARTRSS